MKKIFQNIVAFTLVFALVIAVVPMTTASAEDTAQKCDTDFYSSNDIIYFNPCAASCAAGSGGNIGVKNTDYTGAEILSQAQLDQISANKPVYEQAATASGVPWPMIAVLHLRETGLKTINPDNGQGLYQDYSKTGGPYEPGKVSDEEFLRQSIWAGNFIKGKASDAALLATGDETVVKDAFFGYNGRAQVYYTQAEALGFSEGSDGSPYVVNKIDALRDPEANPTGWGQIKSDGGDIEYPANSDYGAFVVYSSLAGIGGGAADCSSLSGTINEKIVQLAYSELALWESGEMSAGQSFTKYTYGIQGDWCAWFASYLLKGAGHPVNDSETPYWSYVDQFLTDSPSLGFIVHANGDGYSPKPGDLAIYRDGGHINIVVGYDEGGRMITIGGNENGDPFTSSIVNLATGYGEEATQYIEVK